MADQDTVNSHHNILGGGGGDRLHSFIERVERLEEEKQTLMEDIKEVFSEAKGEGFDVKTLRLVIKRRKMDAADLQEEEALLETYENVISRVLKKHKKKANEPGF